MMRELSASIAILTIIYFQWVSHVNSQYSQIWYDSMSNCKSWTRSSSSIDCAWSSSSCHSQPCVRLEGAEYIKRTTDIDSYSSLQIQVSVGTHEMEAGDYCEVYFRYDSDSWQVLCTINPDNDGDRYEHWNTVCNLPSSVGKTTVKISLENTAEDEDYCYFDNVYLRGIPEVTPTTKPTPKPTREPSTKASTSKPTKRPMPHPTEKQTTPAPV
eukprot:103883_1